ncbi:hypothetical protein HOG21_04970 [bacterium]|nr:hypothetical protein [bacterium]
MFNKIRRKQATLSIYKKANEVIYNLNTLLTNNNLTKEQIKLIRKDTISIYKNFIKEYTILSLYFLNFNKKENYISI